MLHDLKKFSEGSQQHLTKISARSQWDLEKLPTVDFIFSVSYEDAAVFCATEYLYDFSKISARSQQDLNKISVRSQKDRSKISTIESKQDLEKFPTLDFLFSVSKEDAAVFVRNCVSYTRSHLTAPSFKPPI